MNIAVLYCGTSHAKSLMDRCIYFGHNPIMVKSSTPAQDLIGKYEADGVLISGSEKSVLNADAPTVDINLYNLPIPILGICYGMQRMAADLGGVVHRFPEAEKGVCLMGLNPDYYSELHAGFVQQGCDIWMSHSCQVTQEPEGFTIVGSTADTTVAAMERGNLFAVQYHPEKMGHGSGKQIMNNFFKICEEAQNEQQENG